MDKGVAKSLSELQGRTGGHSVLGSCLGRARSDNLARCNEVDGGHGGRVASLKDCVPVISRALSIVIISSLIDIASSS